MAVEHIWNLVAKKLSCEASEDEMRELETLLRNNPELHYPIQTISDLWHSHNAENSANEEANRAFDKHLERMQMLDTPPVAEVEADEVNNTPKRNKKWLVFGLAGLGFLLGIFLGLRKYNNASELSAQKINSEVSTRYGSKTNLVLPDGTKVWLNAGSKLNYDKNYGNAIREVSLTGEAYFDVVKNPEKPFIIHASKIDIKVLGTAFNVKSYPGE